MADAPLESGRVGAGLAAAGLSVGPGELLSLTAYLNLLVKWNRVYNLTGIRDPDELIGRHLAESLALAPLLRGGRIVDVGTGAGLPGIPLAVVAPDKRFVLVESRAKRARFLRHVAGSLVLANVEVRQERAELLRSERAFDTVLARAVAPPAKLIAMIWHLTAPGTVLVLSTAQRLEAEWLALAGEHPLRVLAPDAPRAGRGTIVMLERIRG
jgi:16S rRNA (guanine527-N7)-methyltransferase